MLSRSRGFSLIELMVTISIVAILLAIAAPSFRDLVAGQRIKTASYDILSALTYVRSEAIKRNANVSLAPATGGWQSGWSMTTGSTTLSQHQAFPGLTISGPSSAVIYGRDGRITSTSSPAFGVSSSVSSSVPGRCVSVDLSGLPSSKVGSC